MAVHEVEKTEGITMNDYEILKELYEKARNIPYGVALNLAREARSEEERSFWIRIGDMNLQRIQKEVIERNVF